MSMEEFEKTENLSADGETERFSEKKESAAVLYPKAPPEYFLTDEELKKAQDAKALKKAAKTVGLTLILQFGLILGLNLILLAVLFMAGIFNPNAQQYFYDPAVSQAEQIIFSILVFTLPFIFIPKISGYRISSLISFKKPSKGLFLPLFLFGIAFCSFSNIASAYTDAIFESFGIDYSVEAAANPQGFFGFLLSLIATVITPALAEEFAFRGVILGILRRFGDGFAIITSAIMFGIMHGNFEQMPFAFLVGLVLGYITVKSGSALIAFAVHAFNNFVSLFFEYFLAQLSVATQNIIYTAFLITCMLLGIFALFLLRSKGEIYKLAIADTTCAEKEKYRAVFLNPAVIIFTVICVLESFTFFIKF